MSAAEDRPTPIERSGRSPAMSALDEGILVRLHDAIALERSLEVQLSQARDATRSLIRNGQDRLASKTSSTLTWLALESATGLTQSGLRSRATLGTGTGSEEARRLAHRSAAEARLTVNHPDRFAPATVTAAARLTGTPVSTYRRHAKVDADGLVPAPAGGWPELVRKDPAPAATSPRAN